MTTPYWSEFVPNSTFNRNLSGFHRAFAMGVPCRQRTLTPSGHLVLSHFGFVFVHQTTLPTCVAYRIWHVYRNLHYRIGEVSTEHIQQVWHASRGHWLLRTSGPVPSGLAYVLLVETNPFPNLSLFYRAMLFEYPSVLSRFCLQLGAFVTGTGNGVLLQFDLIIFISVQYFPYLMCWRLSVFMRAWLHRYVNQHSAIYIVLISAYEVEDVNG